ncbi:cytochrome P450 [Physcia stellaris]|nr:cytochrome P450 [Physcia stellaris]
MLLQVLLAVLGLAILQAVRSYTAFRRNLAVAKASGIPYAVLPVYSVGYFWLVTQKLWEPFLHRLPKSWTNWWLAFTLENAPWDQLYEPFAKHGSDTLLLVSRPLEVYGSLMLYGANVVTTEGQIWKAHRKITSPPFSEKNNHLVWAEAIFQAQSMIGSWMEGGTKSPTIATLGEDSMRLALHVISRAGFGRRMQWPKSEPNKVVGTTTSDISEAKSVDIPEGHTMSYADTLSTLLKYMVWILLVPKFILKRLPFKSARTAHQAFIEWGMYLKEMYKSKQEDFARNPQQEGSLDLLGALVKGGGSTNEKSDPASLEKGEPIPAQLTETDILGNAFIFILAGHETTSNSIHFSIIFLALHPTAQHALHRDLDRIFAGKPPEQWDYETYLPQLLNSMAGAVLSEELRLIPPVVSLPKCVRAHPQQLTVNGKKCFVPAGSYISILTTAAHRNPNCWPTGPPQKENSIRPDLNTDNDLEEFKPERWFVNRKNEANEKEDISDRGDSHLDVPTSLYRPRRGAYIPFSEGARSCLGRRFAQVKVMAALATIFSEYSVELALDGFAEEEELRGMSERQREEVWEKAKQDAFRKLRENMRSLFTLQLRGEDVKVRFVRRRGTLGGDQ